MHSKCTRILALDHVIAALVGLQAAWALTCFPKAPALHVTSDRRVVGGEFGDTASLTPPYVFPGLSRCFEVDGLDLILVKFLCIEPPLFKPPPLKFLSDGRYEFLAYLFVVNPNGPFIIAHLLRCGRVLTMA